MPPLARIILEILNVGFEILLEEKPGDHLSHLVRRIDMIPALLIAARDPLGVVHDSVVDPAP